MSGKAVSNVVAGKGSRGNQESNQYRTYQSTRSRGQPELNSSYSSSATRPLRTGDVPRDEVAFSHIESARKETSNFSTTSDANMEEKQRKVRRVVDQINANLKRNEDSTYSGNTNSSMKNQNNKRNLRSRSSSPENSNYESSSFRGHKDYRSEETDQNNAKHRNSRKVEIFDSRRKSSRLSDNERNDDINGPSWRNTTQNYQERRNPTRTPPLTANRNFENENRESMRNNKNSESSNRNQRGGEWQRGKNWTKEPVVATRKESNARPILQLILVIQVQQTEIK